ncbi:siroheme synthase [Salipaludibacillus agaradhaerens]|jgi:precorrin-2 dehydrogenase/sirohydrochlorin ferrochelatase|uniref:precorrin-2 dehydrogenase n=1 Tax=Salipaludibacillus agaradhaerens TaxID=76935 RepID=A0A9Q4B4N5_SALAG|nr:NAD(P)-dependent oxidoreductase [Salipaludibacillus agaradhaerens]MCR6097947.1 siroheme synthase [Salipaludibacillus agaradhaerens]MCR6116424.1 siroheme synthase [Salipaludibacillus agaradhaerens]
MNDAIPSMICLTGRRCIVIGGGTVASRHVRRLIEAKGDVTVISPELSPSLSSRKDDFTFYERIFKAGDTTGAFLVIAATNHSQLNEVIYEEAVKSVPLVNIASNQALSNFFFPKVVKRGPLQLAVSTSGTSPFLTKKIANELEHQYGHEYGDYLIKAGELRQRILASDLTSEQKKQLLKQLTAPALLDAFRTHDQKAINEIIAQLNL